VIAGFIGFGFVCTQKYCSQNHIMNKELKWIMLNKIDIFIKIFCVCVCVCYVCLLYTVCVCYISLDS
jgi:ABC-type spermidine/putrescine transport system permease subunit I